MLSDPLCPRCSEFSEDTSHVFKDCIWAKQVWFASALTIKMDNNPITFVEWLTHMLNTLDKNSMAYVAAIMYQIWPSRNLLIFQNKCIPAEEAATKASSLLSEFRSCNKHLYLKPPSDNLSLQCCNTRLSPPSKDWLKLNVDAHFVSDGHLGLGWILRREDGGTVAVVTKVVRSGSDAKIAEALGILEALCYIHENKLNSVVVESDSQVSIKAIVEKSFDKTYWGKIIRSCSQIGSWLDKIEFMWTNRGNNHTAHEIARWVAFEPDRQWTSRIPRPIFDHIQKDTML